LSEYAKLKTDYFLLILFLFTFSCKKEEEHLFQNVSNPYYDKAYEFLANKNIDSSFVYFNLAKDKFIQQKDSARAGNSLVNMAIISATAGDNLGSLETSLNAIKYLNEDNNNLYPIIKSNYNNIGIVTYNLKDYKKSLSFYDLAIKFSDNLSDTNVYLNNKAKVLQELKSYKEAIKIYDMILAENNKNQIEYSRAVTNLAKTKWLQNPNYNPVPEFQKALKIRLKENDLWGQNASYAHLADYYAKKYPDSALVYARKMYSIAKEIESPDDQIEALQKLILLENSQNSKKYFQVYQKLNDSLQTARNKAKNQFALIRYETEKSKAENLKLQKENAEKKYQIISQRIVTAAIIISIIIISIILYFRYKKQKLKAQQEKELEIKNTELRYSKKVHDKVANKVYQVMSEVENTPEMEKNTVLDKLETIYEISRDISYESAEPDFDTDFASALSEMMKSYSSENVQVFIVGNEHRFWQDVKIKSRSEIYYILQELFTNMKKHSCAKRVTVKFSCDQNQIFIEYSDNGKGADNFSEKNGLKNTGNRINSIRGSIIFDTEKDKGFKANLSFPVE